MHGNSERRLQLIFPLLHHFLDVTAAKPRGLENNEGKTKKICAALKIKENFGQFFPPLMPPLFELKKSYMSFVIPLCNAVLMQEPKSHPNY